MFRSASQKLIIAARMGSLDTVHRLLHKKGADVNSKDKNGWTVLMHACACGQGAIFIKHRHQPVESFDEYRFIMSSLMAGATRGKYLDIVKVLLENGANVGSHDPYTGATALLLASVMGHFDIVKVLLEGGADVDSQDVYRHTALMLASLFGHVEVAKVLLECGADVDSQDVDRHTALIWASFFGRLEVAKTLLDHGADIMITNDEGISAKKAAEHMGHDNIASILAKVITLICITPSSHIHVSHSCIHYNRIKEQERKAFELLIQV